MVGYIQDAVAKALSDWTTLKTANVVPVRANEGGSVVINTPLPAVIVHVVGTDGEGNTFIGGGIRQYFDLELWVLIDIPNYSFSPDKGLQAAKLDLSDDVIRCVEHPDFLSNEKQVHDLNMQFDRMETETTYGTKGSLNITVDVHKVIYNCSVIFDPKATDYDQTANLDQIDLVDYTSLPETADITIAVVGNGVVTCNPDVVTGVVKGTEVILSAHPEIGYSFEKWTYGGVEYTNPILSFYVTANATATATFILITGD